MNSETIEQLLALGNTIYIEKGDILIDSGEKDSNMYILVDGLLRTMFWNGPKEETYAFTTIPTVFFCSYSYFGEQESFFQYEVCTDSRVIKISKQDYDRLMEESHDFSRFMVGIFLGQVFFYERKCQYSLGDAKERYHKLMEDHPNIMNQVSLQTIASYLRITPQHLSKLRREFK